MKKVCSVLFGLCVIWILLVASIRLWALNSNFYIRPYDQMNLAQQLNVSNQDLNRSIETLLDYLDNRTDSISVTITQNDVKKEAFNQREINHMIDVKALYQRVNRAMWISVVLVGIIFIYMGREKQGRLTLARSIVEASFAFVIFVAFIGVWIAIDFTDFWIRFHHVFFDNDLWLLTPGVDFMIDILPETIFNRLVISITSSVVVALVLLNAICIYILRKNRYCEG